MNTPKSRGVIKSPAGGETEKKVTDTFNLSFDPDSYWEFIRWKIFDSSTKTEIPNGTYLNLANPNESDTECTFVNAPREGVDLCLEPVLTARPNVLSYSPIFGSDTCKDSSIQILFDHDMDPCSIYYTNEEKQELLDSGVTEENLLSTEVNGETKYYGYDKNRGTVRHPDWQSYFKNISITDADTGANLNKYFAAPVFESPRRLSIPVQKFDRHSRNTPISIPLWTQVAVQLDKEFSCYVEGKSVNMPSQKTWVYQITSESDTTSPTLTSLNVTSSMELATDAATIRNTPNLQENTTRQINCNIGIRDNGSGPAGDFKVKMKRLGYYNSSGSYTAVSAPTAETTVGYQSVASQNAVYNGTLELVDLNLAEEGVYGISFVFKDRSGNEITKPDNGRMYCFKYRNTSPTPIPTELTAVYKTTDSVQLAWLISGNNFDQYSIRWEGRSARGEAYSGSDTFAKGVSSYTISGTKDSGTLKVYLWTTKSTGEEGGKAGLNVYESSPLDYTLLIPIEDIFTIDGQTFVTGRIQKGTIHTGDSIQIVGYNKSFSTTISRIEMFNRFLTEASEGDNVGIYFGTTINKSDLSRGMCIGSSGELQNHTEFKAFIYFRSTEEGGRSNQIPAGYRPQFYFYNPDLNTSLTGQTSITEPLNPGTSTITDVTLINGLPICEGAEFFVREGATVAGFGKIKTLLD
ncbi:MAG: EF-Tu/IF-2/RF-3 family GTPase [Treponema sp.]|nr:EF-Tu/IF-2/RF-3 family GTPase [Treponema sp.]